MSEGSERRKLLLETLRIRYEDQVELLRALTHIDLRIFSGYITIQLFLGSWIATHPIRTPWARLGLLGIDFALALVAAVLLYNQYLRRTEAVETVKRLNEALGYTELGVFLQDRRINPEPQETPRPGDYSFNLLKRVVGTKHFRPWMRLYHVGIALAFVGLAIVVFATPPEKKVGFLCFEVTPPRSRIFVNDIFIGNTGSQIELHEGTYEIHISHPGFEPQVSRVTIRADSEHVFSTILKRKPK
jgi:hypothetical protein